jgi:putative molybdopterin biosynthesis protein
LSLPLSRAWVTPEDAWNLFRGVLTRCATEVVPLARSMGRVLGADVNSPKNVPPWDTARVDGFACRVQDLTGGPLRVLGVVAAGEIPAWDLGPFSTVRVMTGAGLPRGADGVLPDEQSETADGHTVRALTSLPSGSNVGPRGCWAACGQRVLSRGERIGPTEVAALAACGLRQVEVSRRPRVRIVPTGSELIPAQGAAGDGKMMASHGWYLRWSVEHDGGHAVLDDAVADDVQRIREAVGRGRGEDALVTTGGTGSGERDLVAVAMDSLGATALFRGVQMQPGKTISLYRVGKRPVLCLPGGMGGIRLGYRWLLAPALRSMLGQEPEAPSLLTCFTQTHLRRDLQVHRFVEALVWAAEGRLSAIPVPRGGGCRTSVGRSGNGWMRVPPGEGEIEAGSLVGLLPKGDWLEPTRGSETVGVPGAP